MSLTEIGLFLWPGIIFLTFLLTCGGLVKGRFSPKTNHIVSVGFSIGIFGVQALLLLITKDQMLVLTLLPLTAYFPAIIGVHILSKTRFFETAAVWMLGLLVSYTLLFLQKILTKYIIAVSDMVYPQKEIVMTVCLLLAVASLLFVVFRFLRESFQTYVFENRINWLPFCFPAVMIFILFSYFQSSTTNIMVLVLIFLTALSVFLVVARFLHAAASVRRMQEAEKAVTEQLKMQCLEYEDVCKKMDLGRTYRHNMRHHLSVLSNLAGKGNDEEVVQYINGLDGQLQETERESYCENSAVNAVLSSCIGKAKEAGCAVTAKVCVPAQISFDPLDICAILANALENAIRACQNNHADIERHVRADISFQDNQSLLFLIENPCDMPVRFDNDGFPVVPKREGHGIGLKSIEAIVKKYNGLFRCEWEEGTFRLRAVLFDSQKPCLPPAKKGDAPRKVAQTILLSFFAFCILVNCMPTAAQALEGIPGLGVLIRVVNLRTYDFRWGDTQFYAELPLVELTDDAAARSSNKKTPDTDDVAAAPSEADSSPSEPTKSAQEKSQTVSSPSGTISWEDGDNEIAKPFLPIIPDNPSSEPPPGLSSGIDDMNQKMEEYIRLMRDEFIWYVSHKYHGYVGADILYDTIRNDDEFLSIRFNTTINAGGSGQFSRCFTLSKKTGKVLKLGDLFAENSDYIGVISKEVLRQMTEQVNAGLANYFIPGGIWSEEECFKEIAADQNFYLNHQNQLVIVFDEYEVAPGSAGMPEFAMRAEMLGGIYR